jgi:uncharacterized protein YhhL (DUF1145 family)
MRSVERHAACFCRSTMSIIGLVVTLIVVGVLLYLVNTVIPMAPPIKKILNIVVVLVVCLWLLQVFGLLGGDVVGARGCDVHRRY